MKTLSILTFFLASLLVSVVHSEAALNDRGSGLIYDDVLDITWLQDANYPGITLTWSEAVTWADTLVFQYYDDWRLPLSNCTGSNCTGSEMEHLYTTEGITASSTGIFSDVRPYYYWSITEDSSDSSKAWRFNFNSGTQGTSSKTTTKYAWAVRSGDSLPAVAPEPVSAFLFAAGGSLLVLRQFSRSKR